MFNYRSSDKESCSCFLKEAAKKGIFCGPDHYEGEGKGPLNKKKTFFKLEKKM